MSSTKIVTLLLTLLAFGLFFWPDDSEKTEIRIEENPVSVSARISDRVDQLFANIAAEKADESYNNATSELREQVSQKDFQSYCNKVKTGLGALTEHDLKQMEITERNGQPVVNATFLGQFEQGEGVIAVVYHQHENSIWRLQYLNVNAPGLSDDPSQFREAIELHVEQSDPVTPGDVATVWDISKEPPAKLLENVSVSNIRWRVSSPLQSPKFPASGFVTLLVSQEQKERLKDAKLISVRSTNAK